eukprot:334550_1
MTEEIRDVKQLIQPQIIQNISDTLAQIKADSPAYFQSIEQRLMRLSEETTSRQNDNETKTTELERIKHLMMNELKLELTALFQTQNQTQGNIVDAVKEYVDKIRDEHRSEWMDHVDYISDSPLYELRGEMTIKAVSDQVTQQLTEQIRNDGFAGVLTEELKVFVDTYCWMFIYVGIAMLFVVLFGV